MQLPNNSYVRDYYDRQVSSLSSYTQDRWFSSVVSLFDYRQTERALRRSLRRVSVARAIEIGPGDGVWTRIIKDHVQETLHLVEQSGEMLLRARSTLSDLKGISFEHSDFMEAHPPDKVGLIVAMRCFEYFTDKPHALSKMFSLLEQNGLLIVVTKNADLFTTKSVQTKTLHTDQMSRQEMCTLIQDAGFKMEAVFPAVMRWKANYWLMRFLFAVLQSLSVKTAGLFRVPFIERYATESYLYVARKTA